MSGFNLEDIEKKTAANAPVHKKPRTMPQTQTIDIFSALAQTLHGVRKQILDLKLRRESVEVEFRIGMLVTGNRRWKSYYSKGGCVPLQQNNAMAHGVKFVSGLDEIALHRLKKVLVEEGFTSTFKEERVRTGHNTGRRCIIDNNGHERNCEEKEKILRLDFACVGHNYDGRLEVATETSSNADSAMNWTVERLKRRTSYKKEDGVSELSGGGSWQVDLTEVTTVYLDQDGGKDPETSTELEFELTSNAVLEWLRDDKEEEDSRRQTSKIATELRDILNTCISQGGDEETDTTDASGSLISSVTPNSYNMMEIKGLNSSIISATRSSFSSDEFLGSMPLNISRRNLIRLEREEYFVTEKSDGVRYLMYIISVEPKSERGTALLLDRAGKCFRPPGAEVLAAGLRIGTVLDGEIVFSIGLKRYIFLVFDVLCNDGVPCAHLPFRDRSSLVESSIMKKCGQINYKSPDHPLWIIRKKFWPKSHLMDLLKLMVSRKGKRIYNESQRRHHRSDGIIFQPNSSYVFGTDINLIKWKWPELASVDLQVLPNVRQNITNEPSLMAGGPDHTLVDCCMRGRSHVGLGKFDTWRLLADVGDSNTRVHIAEVAFCPEVGLWSYFQLRLDKLIPNYINTVLSILMEQAERIDIEELVMRLVPQCQTENILKSSA